MALEEIAHLQSQQDFLSEPPDIRINKEGALILINVNYTRTLENRSYTSGTDISYNPNNFEDKISMSEYLSTVDNDKKKEKNYQQPKPIKLTSIFIEKGKVTRRTGPDWSAERRQVESVYNTLYSIKSDVMEAVKKSETDIKYNELLKHLQNVCESLPHLPGAMNQLIEQGLNSAEKTGPLTVPDAGGNFDYSSFLKNNSDLKIEK